MSLPRIACSSLLFLAFTGRPAWPQEERLDVAFLVWDGMELIESMGPAHVFSFAPGMDELTVSKTLDPIRSEFVTIVPEHTLEGCPEPDVIVIPGGSLWVPMGDPAYRDWLQRHVPRARLTLSVCNSAILLADLGLLDGRAATCGDANIDDIMLLGKDVRGYTNHRWVHDGNVITSESYLGGIDAAIYAVRVLRGPEGEAQVLSWSNYDGDLSRFDELHAEPGVIPVSRRREVLEILERDGVEAAAERFREWVASGEPAYTPPLDRFDESSLFQWMAWGNQRLGRHERSLAICELKAAIWPDSAAERAYLGEAMMKAGRLEDALGALLEALQLDPTDRRALAFLKELLGRRELEPGEDTRAARAILREQASSPEASLVPEGEPGTPLSVTGVVRDEAGAPVAGASIHVHQADAEGFYRPGERADGRDARLFADLKTGADGTFRLETVRPGTSGDAPEALPAHVTFQVVAPGFEPWSFRMVLADDSRMDLFRWQEWTAEGDYPVVDVVTDPDARQRCELEISLKRASER